MVKDLKNSLDNVVNEKFSNPFWGTLLLSWMVWNWKILILLFFIGEQSLPINKSNLTKYTKIEYVQEFYSDSISLYWGPISSTIIIIVFAPFVVNGAFWLSMKFKVWRLVQKDKLESKRLLTIEKSLELRKALKEKDESIHKIIEEKDDVISLKDSQVSSLQIELSEKGNLVKEVDRKLKELQMEYDNQKIILKEIDNKYQTSKSDLMFERNEKNKHESELSNLRLEYNNSMTISQKYKDELDEIVKENIVLKNEIENKSVERYLFSIIQGDKNLKDAMKKVSTFFYSKVTSLKYNFFSEEELDFFFLHELLVKKDNSIELSDFGKNFVLYYNKMIVINSTRK
jgi:hypothetical protein